MERAWGRWLVAAVITVTVGGCGTPGDGDLVDDWTAMVDAKAKVPGVGCHDAPVRFIYETNTVTRPPISCDEAHTIETFHVGQVPDALTASPSEGSADYVRLFEACEGLAVEFLGGQWFDARVGLGVTVPSSLQWEGGGRWFRCDLMETVNTSDAVSRRRGTVRNLAKADAAVARRCFTAVGLQSDGRWDYLNPTDCTQPHDAEYAGAFKVPGTQRPTDPKGSGLYKQCYDVIDRYVTGSSRLGYMASLGSQRVWNRGDHYVRCYAWHDKGEVTGSVKGTG
ncbi:hypothetical protein GCM10009557_62380 [Virgisporangium ochraceum]|uniref:Septum formation-related domain-containing protein n=1 Tax=Virgisporangium ochraceum TaxID=65505 RepID=A0A8J3ZWI4_9ACTN|nr:septum formation family protein [Virgisporangium ochraceum]GIJ70921.1 hypothetical protein Voc01_058380 [Virgisporangium ochraceum]